MKGLRGRKARITRGEVRLDQGRATSPSFAGGRPIASVACAPPLRTKLVAAEGQSRTIAPPDGVAAGQRPLAVPTCAEPMGPGSHLLAMQPPEPATVGSECRVTDLGGHPLDVVGWHYKSSQHLDFR